MSFRYLIRSASLLPLVLSACGDLPEPFLGNPGATARRLAMPAAPMLAVPPPAKALLDPRATEDFAELLVSNLQKQEVPTLAREPHKTDWRLAVTAERKSDQVIARYAVQDPSGHEQGALNGSPINASAWTAGETKALAQAAQDAVPKIVALMMSIRATRDKADPNSLVNRVAKLYVPEVTGAPGDGDAALTREIRAKLAQAGPLVQLTPSEADFRVKGTVVVTPLPKGQQQVEIAWTVTRPSGAVTGKVSQLNAVPAGSLDHYWGDVAVMVAQEAAGGIDRVVEQFIGRDGTAVGHDTAPGKTAGPVTGQTKGDTATQDKPATPDKPAAPGKLATTDGSSNRQKSAASGHEAEAGTSSAQAAPTTSKKVVGEDDLAALIKQISRHSSPRPASASRAPPP